MLAQQLEERGVAEARVADLERVAQRPVARRRRASARPSSARVVPARERAAASVVVRGSSSKNALEPLGVEAEAAAAAARGSARASSPSASTPEAKKFASGVLDVAQLLHVRDEAAALHREDEIRPASASRQAR